jgi:signal transduction histidine kinase
MTPLEWFRPPRVVLTLFIGLMVVCALALGWLGWQVLVQYRSVEAQQRKEQLERAADRAVASMERAFAAGSAEVSISANGFMDVTPAGKLAFVPARTALPVAAGYFAEADVLEFTTRDLDRAAGAYARIALSGLPQIRAEALVRLGRVLRRQRKWAAALKAYDSLEKSGAVPVAGMPASLVARSAQCSVLEESGDREGARRKASRLWGDLTGGKWLLTQSALETYLEELRTLAPEATLPPEWSERMAMAEAAQSSFEQSAPSGRHAMLIDGQPVSVSWEKRNGAWKARITGPSTWRTLWSNLEHEAGIALRVTDAEGHIFHGSGQTSPQAAFRPAAISNLPWDLTVSRMAGDAPSQSWTAPRRLLIAGLVVFGLVLVLGSLLIARALSREFAVARLQSDFVSAVSHEFRTPLTSIRQLTEMLARGRMESEQHKQRAYELMLGESDRLRRLVESLLDFGRMQAREYNFRRETLEAAQWSRSVAEEFQEIVRNRGYVIDFSSSSNGARIDGDREALGGALWNLLDNAVKYSPEEKHVRVAVSSANGKLELSVRDAGSGIAKEDLKRVFGKFYRGANAKKQGTKGTGIGLAMVKEIVEAHGGTVHVRSKLGQGSEFTMVLPCREF